MPDGLQFLFFTSSSKSPTTMPDRYKWWTYLDQEGVPAPFDKLR